MRILTFSEFLLENKGPAFAHKVQLFNETEDADAFSWHVPGAELFKLINTADDFNGSMPVILYDNQKENKAFVNSISKGTAYNSPDGILAGKVAIAKRLSADNCPWMPRTVFTKDEASSLKFPIIAKANNTYDSLGVEKIESLKALNKLNGYDVYQEAIIIEREFRIVVFAGLKNPVRKVLLVLEKIPKNAKAKRLRVEESLDIEELKNSDNTKFSWIHHPLSILAELKGINEILNTVLNLNPTLNLSGIDVAVDPEGKVWFIEHNTRASMLSNQSVLAYKAIYEDFYGKQMCEDKELISFADAHFKASANLYPFEKVGDVTHNFSTETI